eukprot:gnl/TRDRNA2_/TRDRNA2_162578_c0_seq1.p1 gnl/TRDRNA2_/TRDRNA2_162578_c0~~gnl/TRDRNA2_/TRDRNA2_162578_c0_seq1.p1  ORF type:complete len:475 (+),score=41.20 gnl/TRDRNA2_/TRDRNA2_162578_c0_seq1:71-1495(+)
MAPAPHVCCGGSSHFCLWLIVWAAHVIRVHGEGEAPRDFDLHHWVTQELHLPFEQHQVVSPDGYLLGLHRLPNPNGKVVFCMHGIVDASPTFFVNKGESLAPLLYRQGYDVWLGNMRGNLYSRNHTYLTTDDSAFWDFTVLDVGRRDLPGIITYVLNATGAQSLAYIGHSLGTTMMWAALATPESEVIVAPRVHLFIALSPILSAARIKGLLSFCKGPPEHILEMFEPSDMFGVLHPKQDPQGYMGVTFHSVLHRLVSTFIVTSFLRKNLYGYSELENEEAAEMATKWAPASTSTKLILHMAQQMRYDSKARDYDYGEDMNFLIYYSSEPPVVDFSTSAVVPTALFWAELDGIVGDPTNMAMARGSLPNRSIVFDKTYPRYTHNTWLYGNRTRDPHYYGLDVLDLLGRFPTVSDNLVERSPVFPQYKLLLWEKNGVKVPGQPASWPEIPPQPSAMPGRTFNEPMAWAWRNGTRE